MTIMPCFLPITIAKLSSAILEVRLASYHMDGKIQSCTVNIYRYNTMEANGRTGCHSNYQQIIQHILGIALASMCNLPKMAIYLQRLKEFPIKAEGFAGSWSDTSISLDSIVLYIQIFTVWHDVKNFCGHFIQTCKHGCLLWPIFLTFGYWRYLEYE